MQRFDGLVVDNERSSLVIWIGSKLSRCFFSCAARANKREKKKIITRRYYTIVVLVRRYCTYVRVTQCIGIRYAGILYNIGTRTHRVRRTRVPNRIEMDGKMADGMRICRDEIVGGWGGGEKEKSV